MMPRDHITPEIDREYRALCAAMGLPPTDLLMRSILGKLIALEHHHRTHFAGTENSLWWLNRQMQTLGWSRLRVTSYVSLLWDERAR
jgi:hypothetical protein